MRARLGALQAQALAELITGGAEGNPFYMEELVKMLIDQGVIVTTPGRWALVSDKLLSIQLPPTLTGVLQARLDGLPAAERAALQLASVLGQHFWGQALAHLQPRAALQLPPLAQRSLVHAREALENGALEDGAQEGGAQEYAFQHQILHPVTYGTVLKSQRQRAHAKAALWFAQAAGARAKDFVGAAAEHFAQAGDTANACE